ncbi:MAG: hybrid sensor histidine kinase/response regulator, partial [Bdellovibrio sp. CG10_big_fil_rev_8_21_14_0_10_47_8]
EAIEQVLPKFKDALKKKNQKIKIKLSPLVVRSDSNLIAGVVTRLIENAIQFGDKDSEIEISAKTEGTETLVAISNEGPHLKSDVIEQILKPFNLNENSLHHSKGTGLGLSVSQAVLKSLGSKLKFTSEDKKVTVSFTLG